MDLTSIWKSMESTVEVAGLCLKEVGDQADFPGMVLHVHEEFDAAWLKERGLGLLVLVCCG
jgi:hypothetical protein